MNPEQMRQALMQEAMQRNGGQPPAPQQQAAAQQPQQGQPALAPEMYEGAADMVKNAMPDGEKMILKTLIDRLKQYPIPGAPAAPMP